MKLKKKIASLDDVPEQYHSLYSEAEGGGYALTIDIEGTAPTSKVKEFRDENIGLRERLEEFERRFEGIDPDVVREMKKKLTEGEEQKLLSQGKIDELVELRSARMREGFEADVAAKAKAVETVTAERDGLLDKLAGYMIDDAVTKSLAEVARIRPGAEDDLRARARRTFRIDPKTGALVADAGGKMEYGKSGDPLTLSEWSKGLVESAGHLFEAPKGSGAEDSGVPARRAAGKIPTDPVEFGENLEAIAKGEIG